MSGHGRPGQEPSPPPLAWALLVIAAALVGGLAAAALVHTSLVIAVAVAVVLGAIAVALAVFLLSQPLARGAMLRGATSISSGRCLVCIVFFAAVSLAAVIWAVRKGAPTRLKLSGAIAGIVAGGIGAAAYAFNCTSDTIPFIAIWYGAAIALCAVIGALIGPRVLRW